MRERYTPLRQRWREDAACSSRGQGAAEQRWTPALAAAGGVAAWQALVRGCSPLEAYEASLSLLLRDAPSVAVSLALSDG
jgi:hypothetical protein